MNKQTFHLLNPRFPVYRCSAYALSILMLILSEGWLNVAWMLSLNQADTVVHNASANASPCGSGSLPHPGTGGGCCGSCPSCGGGNPHLPGDGNGGAPIHGLGGNPRAIDDEINLVNGNFVLTENDLVIPGLTGGLRVIRRYNSLGSSVDGHFGFGWSYNSGGEIKLKTSTSGDIRIQMPDGGIRVYFINRQMPIAGTVIISYVPAANLTSTLSRVGTNWVEKDQNGNRRNFDSNGNLISIVDPNGNTTTLSYNDGRLSSVTDPTGRSLSFTYQGNHITRIMDPAGREFKYTYGSTGDLSTYTNPRGDVWIYYYDAFHRLTKITNPLNYSTELTYDTAGKISTRKNNIGGTKTFAYVDTFTTKVRDERGNDWIWSHTSQSQDRYLITPPGDSLIFMYGSNKRLIASVNAMGNAALQRYDDSGNMFLRTDENGNTTTFVFDTENAVTKVIDANGGVKLFEYNSSRRLARYSDANGFSTSYTYDAFGLRTSITNPLSQTSFMEYDQYGNLIKTTDQNGNITEYGYDILGNIITLKEPNGVITTFEYDALNRRSKTISADGSNIQFFYDALNLKKITDPNGNSVSYTYDPMNRLIEKTFPNGGTAKFIYDATGNIIEWVDPNLNSVNFSYDTKNRLINVEYPTVQGVQPKESLTYDRTDNIVQLVTPRGDTIQYARDKVGRITSVLYSDGDTVSYQYDSLGRRKRVSSQEGVSSYTYDIKGNLVSTTDIQGKTFSYVFDPLGRVTMMTDFDNKTTEYDYTARNRVKNIDYDNSQLTTFEYDNMDRHSKITLPNGVFSTYRYDSRSRPTFLGNYKQNGDTISAFQYAYDPVGNRVGIFESNGDSTSIVYDSSYQVIKEIKRNAAGDSIYGRRYDYDSSGNRILEEELRSGETASLIYDSNHRLLVRGNDTFSYDLNGNLVQHFDSTVLRIHAWDVGNRLKSIRVNADSSQFKYDAEGRRIEVLDTAGVATRFVWDVIRENEYADLVNGAIRNKYTYGTRIDQLITKNSDSSTVYYLSDVIGNIVESTDAQQNIVNTYRYSGFGSMVSSSGSGLDPFNFTARRNDGNQLYYFRARYYSPSIGRFVSKDPLKLHYNPYTYAMNNPFFYVDPMGMKVEVCSQALDFGLPSIMNWAYGASGGAISHCYIKTGSHSGGIGFAPADPKLYMAWLILDLIVSVATNPTKIQGLINWANSVYNTYVPGDVSESHGSKPGLSSDCYEVAASDCSSSSCGVPESCVDSEISSSQASPPDYNIVNFNCKNWAESIFSACGCSVSCP